jgi:hypothetical protein
MVGSPLTSIGFNAYSHIKSPTLENVKVLRKMLHWAMVIFFIFALFQTCSLQVSMGSHHVPNSFPMRSPRLFPIAPHFNPICFAQSPSLLTYIGGPKGEAPHPSIESSILESLHSFNFLFCDGPIKLSHCKKRFVLVRHRWQINMSQKISTPGE